MKNESNLEKNCTKGSACVAEYTCLRAEMQQRIESLSGHNMMAMTIVIAIWAFGGALISACYQNSVPDSLICGLLALQAVIFAMPLFFLAPLSVKNADNFRQITSISCYIRAFYELPKYFKKGNEDEIQFWEIANCNIQDNVYTKLEKLSSKFINKEYFVMGLLCAVLYVFMAFVIGWQLWHKNIAWFIAFLVGAGCFFICILICLFALYAASDTIVLVKKHRKMCMEKYLKMAIGYGFIDGSHYDRAMEICTVERIDDILSEEKIRQDRR